MTARQTTLLLPHGARTVVDAGVLVAALLGPDSASGVLLRQLVEHRAFEMVLTDEILSELEDSLADPRVRRQLKLNASGRNRVAAALSVLATFVEVDASSEMPCVEDDPGDSKYLLAALAAHAPFVVSNDPHLLCHSGEPQVLSARMFLEGLELAG